MIRRRLSPWTTAFDYGQNHGSKELPYAQYHCEKLGIPHITIPLSFMHEYFKSSLLDGAEAIPEGHYEEENMKYTNHLIAYQRKTSIVRRTL